MALVTITSFYGQDSVAGSRTVILSNLTTLASAVNALANFLDPTLQQITNLVNISISLPTSSSPITTVIFSSAGSGSFAGNLSVGQAVSATGVNVGAGGIVVSGGNINVTNSANGIFSAGDVSIGQREKILGTALLDAPTFSAIPGTGYAVAGSRVVMMTCTGDLTLDVAQDGQRVTFYNTGSGTINFQNTNFTNLVTAPITLNSAGQILDLWFKNSAWHVLGTQGDVVVSY